MEQSNLYLHRFYTQLPVAMPLPMPMAMTKPAPLAMPVEDINQQVELELQQLKTHFANAEQRYVDQMLIENPIVVERRAPPAAPNKAPQPAAAASSVPSSREVQRQRAESCRKSRYNNKIKKAKLRFRHKFVCNQLTESAGVLDYMRDVIAQAETQLLARGFNRANLERMRQNFGIDQAAATAAAMTAMDVMELQQQQPQH